MRDRKNGCLHDLRKKIGKCTQQLGIHNDHLAVHEEDDIRQSDRKVFDKMS